MPGDVGGHDQYANDPLVIKSRSDRHDAHPDNGHGGVCPSGDVVWVTTPGRDRSMELAFGNPPLTIGAPEPDSAVVGWH